MKGFRIGGYVPEYRKHVLTGTIGHSILSRLNEIYLFSIEVDEKTGYLKETDRILSSMDKNGETIVSDLRKGGGGGRLGAHVVVGGAGRSRSFDKIARNVKKTRQFGIALRQFCMKHHLKGVIIDWEGPFSNVRFEAMLKRIKVQLKELELGVALHTWNPLKHYEDVDTVHVMAYDMIRDRGHSLMRDTREAVNAILASGAPPKKIVLGIPAYCRALSNPGLVKTFEEVVREADLWDGGDIVTIDGVEYGCNSFATVAEKAAYASERGLGGVFFWELGQDAVRSDYALTLAVHAGIETSSLRSAALDAENRARRSRGSGVKGEL